MQTVLSTAATHEPVTLAEAKVFLKVRNTTEDTLISDMIPSARKLCEDHARITISPAKWTIVARAPHYSSGDDFGLTRSLQDPDKVARGVRLPRPPVTAVESVTFIKMDGQREAAVVGVDYAFDVNLGSLLWVDRTKLFAWENTWVEIVFAAGYPLVGDAPAEGDPDTRPVGCPKDIKTAIQETMTKMYEDRGDGDGQLPAMAIQRLSGYWQTAVRAR